MINDYELLLDSALLPKSLDDMAVLLDKNISFEAPENHIHALLHGVELSIINSIPTLSQEGVAQSIKQGLVSILEFIKKLFKNIVKFIKKIYSRVFGKNGVNEVKADEKKAKDLNLDLSLIEDNANKNFVSLIHYKKMDEYEFTINELFGNRNYIEMLKKIYPKDSVDEVINFRFNSIDDITSTQLDFIFKTDYTSLENYILEVVDAINEKTYEVNSDIKILKVDRSYLVQNDTKDLPVLTNTIVEPSALSTVADIDTINEYLLNGPMKALAKSVDDINENVFVSGDVPKVRKILAILNLTQAHTNQLLVYANRHNDLINTLFKISLYEATIKEIKQKEELNA